MKFKKQKNITNKNKPPLKVKISRTYEKGKITIGKHLWLELLTMVVIALITATAVFLMVSHFINSTEMGTMNMLLILKEENMFKINY